MNKSPYSNLPRERFWKTGVEQQHALAPGKMFVPKFPIDRKLRFATAGSCFAQHIARHLRANGFSVLDVEPAPTGIADDVGRKFGYNLYSARYGNVYFARQLLQILKEAFEGKRFEEPVWRRGDCYFDAFRPSVEPEGLSSETEVNAHRAHHIAKVKELFESCDVFVFTLGLTEAWEHSASGTVYPTAPGTIAGSFDSDVYSFKNFDYTEILEDLMEVRAMLRGINPDIKFILTVSPVPLTATASENHVLPATVYSKSVLRAVAGHFSSSFDDVEYFPSYEIIAAHPSKGFYFEPNMRSVHNAGVEVVMKTFFEGYGIHTESGIDEPERQERSTVKAEAYDGDDGDDVVCEDALLEAFSR